MSDYWVLVGVYWTKERKGRREGRKERRKKGKGERKERREAGKRIRKERRGDMNFLNLQHLFP